MEQREKIRLLEIAKKQAKENLKKLEKESYHYITEISINNLKLEIEEKEKELSKEK